ncbi:hypothetical protein Ait01nite_040180 [Actinoplanes italicus]|uniref:Carboxypeptidase family protein n=1 Tax=Actinoplanes italicus TaxID=113567 RepID=A0A2T0K281_9ACTN|nr:carboxypeptidase-like regulatory domain-containing protein [Actinoplanes italicus]PRX16894.1 carboxypeptidase family protein [Actinoplanes italicus]GIE30973.1 hypothetical protein Ait01nite_040180 [Actinoplanes italicus]
MRRCRNGTSSPGFGELGIEGTLTTADGSAPVAGARLQITACSGTPGYLLPEAVTDESGHYRLEPLPAGRYRIGFYFADTGDQLWAPHKTRETAVSPAPGRPSPRAP